MTAAPQDFDFPYLGRRVAFARKRVGLTQEQLSKSLGFADRQTLQSIEAGQRRVSMQEMLDLMDATSLPLDFFVDPFSLVGEGEFAFSASQVSEDALEGFESNAGRWIAAWWHLGERRGESSSMLRFRLAINSRSTPQDAQTAGEELAREWKLGRVPAERLLAAAEQNLRVLVLAADMPRGVLAASCRVSAGDAVLINRQATASCRVDSLAHELFRILTWDAMPAANVERRGSSGYKRKHFEILAKSFVGAILMPASEIKGGLASRPQSIGVDDWLLSLANHFCVPVGTVVHRYSELGVFSEEECDAIQASQLSAGRDSGGHIPPLFSRQFMARIGWSVGRGEMSARYAANLLNTTVQGMADLFVAHGLEVPFPL